MLRISFNKSDERVVAALRRKGPQIKEALREELDLLMLELQRRVQQKLSGEVLQQRTGKLLGSIVKEPTVVSGGKITARVSGAAGPAFYGRIQEKGGTREYEIRPRRKKALAFFPGGSEGAAASYKGTRGLFFKQGKRRGSLRPGRLAAFGGLGGVVVKSVVHPPLRARPFMSTSLEEMRAAIIERVKMAVERGLKA